jgi:hypothetical protein
MKTIASYLKVVDEKWGEFVESEIETERVARAVRSGSISCSGVRDVL